MSEEFYTCPNCDGEMVKDTEEGENVIVCVDCGYKEERK
jgi:DNA-directed RNA polymerase subunit M/transcription elongation factor TFIIS